MNIDVCDECGREIAGGREACRTDFDRLLARDFSEPLFFRTHRLFVATYALQHPEQFCRSAKSFAAHLLDLCAILERSADSAAGYQPLQRWLNGNVALDKPRLPSYRGGYTLAHLTDLNNPEAWDSAVHEWAKTIWEAYRELHEWARHFLNKTMPSPPS